MILIPVWIYLAVMLLCKKMAHAGLTYAIGWGMFVIGTGTMLTMQKLAALSDGARAGSPILIELITLAVCVWSIRLGIAICHRSLGEIIDTFDSPS